MYLSATVFTLFEPITAKWRLFRGYLSLTPSFGGTPAPSGTKFCHDKLETWGSPHWKFRIPSLHRFDTVHECDRQTDRQTDGQTDAQTMAKTREAFCFRA